MVSVCAAGEELSPEQLAELEEKRIKDSQTFMTAGAPRRRAG